MALPAPSATTVLPNDQAKRSPYTVEPEQRARHRPLFWEYSLAWGMKLGESSPLKAPYHACCKLHLKEPHPNPWPTLLGHYLTPWDIPHLRRLTCCKRHFVGAAATGSADVGKRRGQHFTDAVAIHSRVLAKAVARAPGRVLERGARVH